MHDSCVDARNEDVVAQPRELLAAARVAVREPAHAGKLTWCCGGPAEALDPVRAAQVPAARVEQLRSVAAECVRAGESLRIRDISEYLAETTIDGDPGATTRSR